MEPVLRPAAPGDVQALAGLATQLGYPNTPEQIASRLAALAATPGHAVLVVADPAGGTVIGWIHVGSTRWLESDPYAEIGGLVVDADWRGRGIGERLVRAGLAWAAAQRFREMRVRSNVVRADAHRFYERLGFARVKTQAVFTCPL
jgi:GNAT superfamily N-acetyltransferase